MKYVMKDLTPSASFYNLCILKNDPRSNYLSQGRLNTRLRRMKGNTETGWRHAGGMSERGIFHRLQLQDGRRLRLIVYSYCERARCVCRFITLLALLSWYTGLSGDRTSNSDNRCIMALTA